MSRRSAYVIVALACALPRLAVLLHERGAITASYTEKSDTFALTFVQHGTFGFIPGDPSAYTQPLYGFVLVPLYWIAGRSWLSIGLYQIALAIVTAWLVLEVGRRVLGVGLGAVAAVVATLNPYLVWHDMHVNREIVDQVCAAAVVLLTLVVAARPRLGLAVLLGIGTGLAILGNTRLVFIPILCALYLLWRLPREWHSVAVAALVLAGAAVAVAPWLVRNKTSVGCWAITTDGRALWKANNVQTYGLLSSGRWIDDVRNPPRPKNAYYTPEEAWSVYIRPGHAAEGRRLYPNECLQMRYFEHLAFRFWHEHPGEKAKLMALSAKLLWQPNVFETTGRNGKGGNLDVGRRVVEPVYMWTLYAVAAAGILVAPVPFVALSLLLLAYQTAAALAFVGATRYRVAWDFLLAVLAAAALRELARRRASSR